MKTRLCAVLALMLLATACATTRLRTEFDDVPLPTGLTYQPQRSVVIESPSVRAAKLVYRGRLEPASLALVMRAMLESNGDRKSTRLNSSHVAISYAVFCLKKKNNQKDP